MTYYVPTSAIPLLQDPPFVLWIVLLGAAIGYRALRLIQAPLRESTRLERGVLSAAVGLGLLQYLAYGLGMAGALRPAAVWIGLIVLSVLFLPTAIHIVRSAWVNALEVRRAPPPRWILVGAALMACLLLVVMLQALTPPGDADGLGYHLNAPKRWLTTGRLDYLPTFVHTNAPMGVEMLFTLAMAVWSDTAAKLIHFALGILSLLAVFALGRRVGGPAVGFTAAALVMNSPPPIGALESLTWSNVDFGVMLELVCAILAWLLWTRSRARGWLYAAALCAGFAATFKLTAAFVGVALGALTAVEIFRSSKEPGAAMRNGAVVIAISLLPVIPWLIRSWLVTGNPVYPVLSNVFPSRDWDAAAGRAFDGYFKYYNWGSSRAVYVSIATRKAARVVAIVGTLGIGAALALRWRDLDGRRLAAITAALLLGAFLFTGFYARFLFPIVPLVYIIACLALAAPLARSRWIHACILAYVLVKASRTISQFYPPIREAVLADLGMMSRQTYLARNMDLAPIWNFVNTRAPVDAPILITALHPGLGITGGLCYYYDQPCYTTDAYLQRRYRMDSWPEFVRTVARDHIQYVVIPAGVFFTRVGPDYAPAQNEMPFGRRLVDTYGQLLFASGRYQLFRLRGLPIPSDAR